MLKRFEYDGVSFEEKKLHIIGTFDLEWFKDGITSDYGERSVTQSLNRFVVSDIVIEEIEEISDEGDFPLNPDNPVYLNFVKELLEEEDFDWND